MARYLRARVQNWRTVFATSRVGVMVVAMIALAVVSGCASNTYKEPSAISLKLAPGTYEAVLTGSRTAIIEIADDLAYKYVEDSTRNGVIKQVRRNGTLRFSTWRKAKAGNIRLEWVSEDTIKVVSPYGSTIGNGNNEGNLAYSSGPFLTGMPSHTFYMNRLEAE